MKYLFLILDILVVALMFSYFIVLFFDLITALKLSIVTIVFALIREMIISYQEKG